MVTLLMRDGFFSVDQLREAEAWLAVDYGWVGLEWGYLGARRLLLAEELLRGQDGFCPPPDYKFFTFGGVVEMIQVDTARFNDHRRVLRRRDWSPIDGILRYQLPDESDWACPPNFDLMLGIASELGRDLDFVREICTT